MLPLNLLTEKGKPLRVLLIGAHSDDIEIGCGGTILTIIEKEIPLQILWVVFSAREARAAEARTSAKRFTRGAEKLVVELHEFRDGFFPHHHAEIKEHFERLKLAFAPDLIFTHHRHDLHQDHRVVNELTWNTWRNHLILEYEIPKYDGDLGTPNLFVPVTQKIAKKKSSILLSAFLSQRQKQWFDEELFMGLMRLRGVEANSPTRYAEGFHVRKATLG